MAHKTHLSCPIQRTMAMIADKWKIIVILILRGGRRRFAELQRDMDGITAKVLTRQLRDLEEDGIVSRTVYAQVPPRVEYALTPLGESLSNALCPLHEWAKEHAAMLGNAPKQLDADSDSAA